MRMRMLVRRLPLLLLHPRLRRRGPLLLPQHIRSRRVLSARAAPTLCASPPRRQRPPPRHRRATPSCGPVLVLGHRREIPCRIWRCVRILRSDAFQLESAVCGDAPTVVFRLGMPGVLPPAAPGTRFHAPPTGEWPSSSTSTSSSHSSADPGPPGPCCGGGGMSSMNQSCCAIRNSSTRWLRSCSAGDISCAGCEIRPGRNITARSVRVSVQT